MAVSPYSGKWYVGCSVGARWLFSYIAMLFRCCFFWFLFYLFEVFLGARRLSESCCAMDVHDDDKETHEFAKESTKKKTICLYEISDRVLRSLSECLIVGRKQQHAAVHRQQKPSPFCETIEFEFELCALAAPFTCKHILYGARDSFRIQTPIHSDRPKTEETSEIINNDASPFAQNMSRK